MTLELTTILNGERRTWSLEGEKIMIGRSSRHPINLADGTVSKDHAEIVRRGDGWALRDLGSRNGTRVNGVEAAEPLAIRADDTVEVGKVMLRVVRPGPTAPALSMAGGMSSSVRLRAQEVLSRPTTRTGQDAARLVHMLSEAGRMLVLPRSLSETCETILAFVEKAVPASRLVILVRDGDDAELLQVAARSHGGSSRQPLAMSRTIMDTVLNECTSVLTSDALADARFRLQQSIVAQSVHSAMAVPLFDNERVLGLMYADSTDPRVTFDQDQLEVFTLLANMAAVKITNARLLEAEQEQARIAQELSTARRIQRSLLPEAPNIAGLECHASLETCFEVGGDLYDFHVRGDGRLLFMVGDVTGKGMGAALLMSSVLSSARVLYDTCDDPADFMVRLNAVVDRSTDPGRFVTLFFGSLDAGTGELHYVNAGHNAPLLVKEGAFRELLAEGIPLGVLPKFPYTATRVDMNPGELLAVFTDGIPEAERSSPREFFGDERLQAALMARADSASLEAAAEGLMAEVETFVAGTPRSDDITLVLLRRR